MSSAARTNAMPGLVMLGISPQSALACCCALTNAFVLQALLNPCFLCSTGSTGDAPWLDSKAHPSTWASTSAVWQVPALIAGLYSKLTNLMGVLYSLTDAGAWSQLLWTLCVCFQACSPCSTLHCWVCREKHHAANNWKFTAWLGLNSGTFIMGKKPPNYWI